MSSSHNAWRAVVLVDSYGHARRVQFHGVKIAGELMIVPVLKLAEASHLTVSVRRFAESYYVDDELRM